MFGSKCGRGCGAKLGAPKGLVFLGPSFGLGENSNGLSKSSNHCGLSNGTSGLNSGRGGTGADGFNCCGVNHS